MIEAKGINSELSMDENFVYITRTRWTLEHGFAGKKQIPIANITSIQFRGARFGGRAFIGSTGYIQLGVLGGVEARRGVLAAQNDENTVLFGPKEQPAFEQFRDQLQAQLARRMQSPATPAVAAPVSVADEIRKFAELHREGLLSDVEFEAAKARLLQ